MMAKFVCPACRAHLLQIQSSVALPPCGDDDEITLQAIECMGCQFHGIAVYRESRHGALDSESWSHTGYELVPADLERLRSAMLSCAAPEGRRCQCDAHKSLAAIDWAAPARAFTVKRKFSMELVKS